MRKIILPVIISASLFGAVGMHAGDEQEKAKEDMPRPILLTKKVPSPQKRPHMPSNQTLMFYYLSLIHI